MNKVTLVGNLGADAETREINEKLSVASLRLATTRRRKKGEGWVEETTWHRVKHFVRPGSGLVSFLTKGATVAVSGRIEVDQYEKDGQKRTSVEIVADELHLVGARKKDRSDDLPF